MLRHRLILLAGAGFLNACALPDKQCTACKVLRARLILVPNVSLPRRRGISVKQ